MSDHLAAAPVASDVAPPADESPLHLLLFADRGMPVRLDARELPADLRLHALALTESAHATLVGLHEVRTQLQRLDDVSMEQFLSSALVLVQFALAASVAIQLDANEAALAKRGAA